MPPKKKSVIVVGTVSTRSTRRQSVVNIDIPPKSPGKEKKAKTPNDPSKQAKSTKATPKPKKLYTKKGKKVKTNDVPQNESIAAEIEEKNPGEISVNDIINEWSDDNDKSECEAPGAPEAPGKSLIAKAECNASFDEIEECSMDVTTGFPDVKLHDTEVEQEDEKGDTVEEIISLDSNSKDSNYIQDSYSKDSSFIQDTISIDDSNSSDLDKNEGTANVEISKQVEVNQEEMEFVMGPSHTQEATSDDSNQAVYCSSEESNPISNEDSCSQPERLELEIIAIDSNSESSENGSVSREKALTFDKHEGVTEYLLPADSNSVDEEQLKGNFKEEKSKLITLDQSSFKGITAQLVSSHIKLMSGEMEENSMLENPSVSSSDEKLSTNLEIQRENNLEPETCIDDNTEVNISGENIIEKKFKYLVSEDSNSMSKKMEEEAEITTTNEDYIEETSDCSKLEDSYLIEDTLPKKSKKKKTTVRPKVATRKSTRGKLQILKPVDSESEEKLYIEENKEENIKESQEKLIAHENVGVLFILDDSNSLQEKPCPRENMQENSVNNEENMQYVLTENFSDVSSQEAPTKTPPESNSEENSVSEPMIVGSSEFIEDNAKEVEYEEEPKLILEESKLLNEDSSSAYIEEMDISNEVSIENDTKETLEKEDLLLEEPQEEIIQVETEKDIINDDSNCFCTDDLKYLKQKVIEEKSNSIDDNMDNIEENVEPTIEENEETIIEENFKPAIENIKSTIEENAEPTIEEKLAAFEQDDILKPTEIDESVPESLKTQEKLANPIPEIVEKILKTGKPVTEEEDEFKSVEKFMQANEDTRTIEERLESMENSQGEPELYTGSLDTSNVEESMKNISLADDKGTKKTLQEELETKLVDLNLDGTITTEKPSLPIIDDGTSPTVKSEISPRKQKLLFEEELEKIEIVAVKNRRKSTPTKKSAVKSPKTKTEKEPKKPKVPKPPKEKKIKTPKKEKKVSEKKTPKPKKDKKDDLKEEKKEENKDTATEDELNEANEVRRSSRIKSISVLNKKVKGHGLVRTKSESFILDSENSESSNSGIMEIERNLTPSPMTCKNKKPAFESPKEMGMPTPQKEGVTSSTPEIALPLNKSVPLNKPKVDKVVEGRLKQFVHLKENQYKTDRMVCKEAKKMTCDCFLTPEEIKDGEYGCGEDCLNRLLMIECGNLCSVNDRCTNKRFQKSQYAPIEVFNAEKKGLGLRAAANIPYGEFILEYVGEVLDAEEFDKRAEHYSKDKNIHYYFMSLRVDAIIDATMKGNISRFINHSCDPNAETQKWTVNGELRIGFFSTRTILAGEEVTFDYKFQRYGKEAQKCYCGAAICRGWLGEQPESSEEEDDEEEEESEEMTKTPTAEITKIDDTFGIPALSKPEEIIPKLDSSEEQTEIEKKIPKLTEEESLLPKVETPEIKPPKIKSPKKKPRKELFEDIDQLEEEIDMLVESGLKNQQHTLKLSRLMVRAKEPSQRTKLLRVLRKGELACRRLFLDYHGLRLMHGYMIDAQDLVKTDKKYQASRLEMLQTLVMLPIPNKTMLQDSKVLPTVEKWSKKIDTTSPTDSDSNSPKDQGDVKKTDQVVQTKEDKVIEKKDDVKIEEISINFEEEIVALALKLLEEWSNLKEVFRIPKKERIEQMKEHEREANKKFNQSYNQQEAERRLDSSRNSRGYQQYKDKYKIEKDKKSKEKDEKERVNALYKMTKAERRKLFALQVELKEEERRRKQREQWRQHEQYCMMMGTDPRFTAPFDPTKGYQCIWNPQIGQWQNYPLPDNNEIFSNPTIPNLSVPPPQLAKPVASTYTYPPAQFTPLPYQTQTTVYAAQVEEDPSKVKFMGPIPPPAKLPPKWKMAKDKYGRPFYYHIKLRKSQWEPPPYTEPPPPEDPESSDDSSSTESSSVTSDSSSDNTDSDDEIDDTKLLLQVRKQMEKTASQKALLVKSIIPSHVKSEKKNSPSPDAFAAEDMEEGDVNMEVDYEDDAPSSIDIRLQEQFDFMREDKPPPSKKRRTGLVQEIIISPRTEEDRLQFKEDLKRYRYNKEKLKRQKEIILAQTKKQQTKQEKSEKLDINEKETEPPPKKVKERKIRLKIVKDSSELNSDEAKRIKEQFRSNMASTVVNVLNNYRKPECTEGRITNNEDFKHLARKLTHFVMLKEIKYIPKIEDLVCSDNVKSKAREYIRKYMAKYGETYQKRADEPEFKD